MTQHQRNDDEYFMAIALEEARKGIGRTSPNPCVGAIIVRNGKILGKGYHKRAGTPHAEINAINDAKKSVQGATIYVTLEPCSHTGKTPPCCQALVDAGFARVVVGMTDPNPLVNGRGIDFLREHGVEVTSGVLTQECEAVNYPFIKFITQGLPWMIMKAGISLDGRLNYLRGSSGWITGKETGIAVHQLRDSVDAIMVGRKTVEIDNPSLTTRLPGKNCKDPIRIIVDSDLTSPIEAKVFHLESKAPTWIICSQSASDEKKRRFTDLGVRIIQVAGEESGVSLKGAMYELAKNDVCSVLVEGGSTLHGSLLRQGLYDFAHLFYAPLFAGDDGVPLISGMGVAGRTHAPKLASPTIKKYGDDVMISGRFESINKMLPG